MSNGNVTPPVLDKDRFGIEYKEIGDRIRHYSTVRSALTTFLLTVAAASFSAYFHRQQTSAFFVATGHLFLVVAAAVCLVFSYRTERAALYQKELAKYATGKRTDLPALLDRTFRPDQSVWRRMFLRDGMNAVLLLVVIGILAAFWITAGAEAAAFDRVIVAVAALLAFVAAVAVFLIVRESRQFWVAVVATLVLAAVPIALGFVLFWRPGAAGN